MELIINPRLNQHELLRLVELAKATDKINDIKTFARGLRKSYVVAAYEDRRLVGLVRAVSDNATYAVIMDLMVEKAPFTQMLAKQLIDHIVAHFNGVGHVIILKNHDIRENPKNFKEIQKSVYIRR